MVYKVIGLMSGSSLDGLDIAYVHLQESIGGSGTADKRSKKWEFTFQQTVTYAYTEDWKRRLARAAGLSALEYQLLHVEYGHYLGQQVLRFIEEHGLHYQVQLIASHGHTAFHIPGRKMTAQLGDGAAIAAATSINVVSDLRALDVALGGQGAPIVPIGEKLLLGGYDYYLNLGGIANISMNTADGSFAAWDICPANRVLNELAGFAGKEYDEGGALAAKGQVDTDVLRQLDALPYYAEPYPKSLANEFGTGVVLPILLQEVDGRALSVEDALRTYVEHIAGQIVRAVRETKGPAGVAQRGGAETRQDGAETTNGGTDALSKMLVTGGGAHNSTLVARLAELLLSLGVEPVVPDTRVVDYKEALIMALIGVLRWREENNVLASVTGAGRDSIGGAVWIGQEA